MQSAAMKAMVLQAPGVLSLEQVVRPVPGAGHLLVRITHTGLCGTDLKIFNGTISVRHPLIMGHEIAGEVVEGEAPGVRPGDRVVIDPVLFCGECFHCRAGQTNLCRHGSLIGRDSNGGFAEYAAVPASHVFRLPPSVDGSTAPLIQVATTCLHGQRRTPLFVGESVVVLGLGVSGQLHVQLAKARGAGVVIGVSRSQFKREMAQAFGADLAIPPGERALTQVLDATNGRGADVVIESTGIMASVADAIHMVRTGGSILLFGIMSATQASLPFYDLYYKELTLLNGRAAKAEDFPATIELIEKGAVRLAPLVTNRMPLGDLEKALATVADGASGRLKIILDHI